MAHEYPDFRFEADILELTNQNKEKPKYLYLAIVLTQTSLPCIAARVFLNKLLGLLLIEINRKHVDDYLVSMLEFHHEIIFYLNFYPQYLQFLQQLGEKNKNVFEEKLRQTSAKQ